jgi:hypothetical protein
VDEVGRAIKHNIFLCVETRSLSLISFAPSNAALSTAQQISSRNLTWKFCIVIPTIPVKLPMPSGNKRGNVAKISSSQEKIYGSI